MKGKAKNIYKLIAGIAIGILISITGVYAATTIIASSEVTYNNSSSGATSNNVQGAIDELYEKANSCGPSQQTFAEYLIEKANSSNITSYSRGNKQEMYAFSHPSTYQTKATTDYRYIGDDPYNYVHFNCNDNYTSCEIWRIIGVFDVDNGTGKIEKRVKLVQDRPQAYLSLVSSGRTYEWDATQAGSYLNNYYSENLSRSAQSMVADAKYYSAAIINLYSAPELYDQERGSYPPHGSTNNMTYMIKKVGLMYPSDYVYTYAYGVDDQLYQHPGYGGNANSGWMHANFYSYDVYQWFFNYFSAYGYAIQKNFNGNLATVYNTESIGVRPVVYLAADVPAPVGDGISANPYLVKS